MAMIRRHPALFLAAAAASAAVAPFAHAADGAGSHAQLPNKQYVLQLGAGAKLQPKYPGADSYILSPFPIITVTRLYFPGLGQVVDGRETVRGFSVFPSFDFIGERSASDSSDLTGTGRVDWALELGLGVAYRYDWLRGFVNARQGFNGHSGQVVDFGLEVIVKPIERLELIFGPRGSWASNDYMDAYFGVTPAEAAAAGSVLTAYNADSGFKTAGLAARVSYALTQMVTLHAQGSWDRFIGNAEDSPIVARGDVDQFSLGAGLSYRFAFDLFD